MQIGGCRYMQVGGCRAGDVQIGYADRRMQIHAGRRMQRHAGEDAESESLTVERTTDHFEGHLTDKPPPTWQAISTQYTREAGVRNLERSVFAYSSPEKCNSLSQGSALALRVSASLPLASKG
jgi:hypothetical protein